jgi:membrane-bound lytic murein transglycosylase D
MAVKGNDPAGQISTPTPAPDPAPVPVSVPAGVSPQSPALAPTPAAVSPQSPSPAPTPAAVSGPAGAPLAPLAEKEIVLADRIKALEGEVLSLRSQLTTLYQQLGQLRLRPPLSTFRLPREILLCGERVPVEDRNVWENLDREFLLALDNEVQVVLWMKRARRYFPYIEGQLREAGLPDDLKYLAIVESSLRPTAVSSAGAAGLWQFIPSTSERFRMRKGKGLDERLDVMKATDGALAYLRSLYEEFRTWSLAMAAYNCGENRVRKEVELQGVRNYYFLDLPAETERYVYKIAVAKTILSDPERYGFLPDEIEVYSPLNGDRVTFDLAQPLPFTEAAAALDLTYKEIREMNPHFSEESIPAGTHVINLPKGKSERFRTFLASRKNGR